MTPSTDAGDGATRPMLLRVVSGSPTPEELAAVIAIVTSHGATSTSEKPTWSLWARKSRQVRPAQRPGFGAWRASMMPR
jgi:hypothetical protein